MFDTEEGRNKGIAEAREDLEYFLGKPLRALIEVTAFARYFAQKELEEGGTEDEETREVSHIMLVANTWASDRALVVGLEAPITETMREELLIEVFTCVPSLQMSWRGEGS